MTMTSSPPMRTSPVANTVSSGLNVRLASLYGSLIRSTSCTPSSISMSRGSTFPLPTTPSTVREAPARPVHVHAELDEVGNHFLHLRVARPFLHDDYHLRAPITRIDTDYAEILIRRLRRLRRLRSLTSIHHQALNEPGRGAGPTTYSAYPRPTHNLGRIIPARCNASLISATVLPSMFPIATFAILQRS